MALAPPIDATGQQQRIDILGDVRLVHGTEVSYFGPVRALDLPPSVINWFTDDDGNTHEDSINRVADAGITLGCGGDEYCPGDHVPRDQMASFLARAVGLDPIIPPPPTTTTTTGATTTTVPAPPDDEWSCSWNRSVEYWNCSGE